MGFDDDDDDDDDHHHLGSPLFRAPLEPLYGPSFDWSPTYQPRHPGERRRRKRGAPRGSRAGSSSAPPFSAPVFRPSAPGADAPSWSTRLLLVILSALPPLWPAFLLLPFLLTGWAFWYLGRQLPGGAFSLAPLLLCSAAPFLCNRLAHLLGNLTQRAPGPLLARGAGRWLLELVKRGAAGDDAAPSATPLTVARLREGGRTNGYLPRHRTILLGDDVIAEPTAAAHALAAHELGHHLLHQRLPRLCAALTWLRGQGARLFQVGLMMLWATALTGEPRWIALAPLCFVAAGLLQTAIAVEEAAASVVAMRVLRRAGLDPAQLRLARRFLCSAFATYACYAAASFVPLLWPPILEGVTAFAGARPPAPPLSALSSVVIALACFTITAGASLALRDLTLRRPRELGARASLLLASAIVLVPFVFILLANQPLGRAFPTLVLLALFPAYPIVTAPPRLSLSALAAVFLPALHPARVHRTSPSSPSLDDFPSVSSEALRSPDAARRATLGTLGLVLALPLATLHLLDLLFGLL